MCATKRPNTTFVVSVSYHIIGRPISVFLCVCTTQRDTVQCPVPSQNTEGGTHTGSWCTALKRTWFYTLTQRMGCFPPCALFLSRVQLLLISTSLLGFRLSSLRYTQVTFPELDIFTHIPFSFEHTITLRRKDFVKQISRNGADGRWWWGMVNALPIIWYFDYLCL